MHMAFSPLVNTTMAPDEKSSQRASPVTPASNKHARHDTPAGMTMTSITQRHAIYCRKAAHIG
eukprot:2891884-Pyramimonas_sp.AAC.1